MKPDNFSLVKLVSIVLITFLLMLYTCKSSDSVSKSTITQEDVDEMVGQHNLTVEFDYAYPLVTTSLNQISNSGLLGPGNSASQISLIGNPNILRIQGDSIKAELPFYGERRMGGNYGFSNIGIEINGLMEDLESSYNENKQRHILSFKADGKNDSYKGILTIFNNGNCELNLIGNNRTAIQYRGRLNPKNNGSDKQIN